MANFKQLQISGRGFDQIDRQRVGRPIVCRFASRLERIEMFPNIDIGKSVVHFAPCAPHLFNVFSPNIAPRISVPVASLGHFRFYGPSVEVNFTSFYRLPDLSPDPSPSAGPNDDRCSSPGAGCGRDGGSRCGETQKGVLGCQRNPEKS